MMRELANITAALLGTVGFVALLTVIFRAVMNGAGDLAFVKTALAVAVFCDLTLLAMGLK